MAANLTPERRPDSDLGSNVKPRKSSVSFYFDNEYLCKMLLRDMFSRFPIIRIHEFCFTNIFLFF